MPCMSGNDLSVSFIREVQCLVRFLRHSSSKWVTSSIHSSLNVSHLSPSVFQPMTLSLQPLQSTLTRLRLTSWQVVSMCQREIISKLQVFWNAFARFCEDVRCRQIFFSFLQASKVLITQNLFCKHVRNEVVFVSNESLWGKMTWSIPHRVPRDSMIPVWAATSLWCQDEEECEGKWRLLEEDETMLPWLGWAESKNAVQRCATTMHVSKSRLAASHQCSAAQEREDVRDKTVQEY